MGVGLYINDPLWIVISEPGGGVQNRASPEVRGRIDR
jgi:hypothetical protein